MKKIIYFALIIAIACGVITFLHKHSSRKAAGCGCGGIEALKNKEFKMREQAEPVDLRILELVSLSGSAQFSKSSLLQILEEIRKQQSNKKSPIAIVDLRQEMHLLGDGKLATTISEKDWSEINHKLEFITKDENNLVDPGVIEREETIVKNLGAQYLRLPVTDDAIPNDKNVDLFLEFYKEQMQNDPKTWFHVHCEHGHGRTTTFMTLLHILNTKGKTKLGDILDEQYEKGKIDLSFPPKDRHALKNVDLQRMRFAFLEEFHQYVNDEESGYFSGKSWSEWKHLVSE